MSDAIETEKLAEIAKIEKYSYLLPGASSEMQAKIDSGTPIEMDETETAPPDTSPMVMPANWPPLSKDAARDRARGCLLGLAVGDAIGAAVEFKPRDSFPALTGMIGGGRFKLRPGQWTDDTTMAICLAESLIAEGQVDQRDLMRRFGRWLQAGENSVTGTCFDIGATTRGAIERFLAGGSAASGSTDPGSAGNGSLTRLAPVALLARTDRAGAEFMALKQSRTTHGAMECLDACKLLASMLVDALSGADLHAAIRPRVIALSPKLLFINAGEWRAKSRAQIRSSGYVVDTLEAAIWAVGTTDSFKSAVLTAANLGDDADSVAAVAGQLAGAIYGASSIPKAWLGRLAWREKIESFADTLFGMSSDAG
jgi:ADP-ribosyl-[dinitrogen reductase] hydrolase